MTTTNRIAATAALIGEPARAAMLAALMDGRALTAAGARFLGGIGIDLAPGSAGARRPTRIFCRPCLDWSERRVHVAGLVGAAICSHVVQAGWVRRMTGTRALAVTPPGRRALSQTFGVELPP